MEPAEAGLGVLSSTASSGRRAGAANLSTSPTSGSQGPLQAVCVPLYLVFQLQAAGSVFQSDGVRGEELTAGLPYPERC